MTYINEIFNKKELKVNKSLYEITVKEDGKVIYKSKGYAGVVCNVEEYKGIDIALDIEGRTQRIVYGHPLISLFAFDQLRQEMTKFVQQVVELLMLKVKQFPDFGEKIQDYFRKRPIN